MSQIRFATQQDAAAVTALWNGMIRDTLATFTTQEKQTSDVATMIRDREGAFWVAEGERVEGFATYGPFRAGPGYAATVEHTIILDPKAQGRGLGRDLMTTLEAKAKEQGMHVLVAGISSANPGAAGFHGALGFVETARMPQVGRKNGQWLNLILMQKTVPSH